MDKKLIIDEDLSVMSTVFGLVCNAQIGFDEESKKYDVYFSTRKGMSGIKNIKRGAKQFYYYYEVFATHVIARFLNNVPLSSITWFEFVGWKGVDERYGTHRMHLKWENKMCLSADVVCGI
jgi:hypothetical protein